MHILFFLPIVDTYQVHQHFITDKRKKVAVLGETGDMLEEQVADAGNIEGVMAQCVALAGGNTVFLCNGSPDVCIENVVRKLLADEEDGDEVLIRRDV